jgi:hypothetical protein
MDAATSSRSTRDRAATAETTSGHSGELIPVLMRIPDVRPPARGKAKRDAITSAAIEPATPLAPPVTINPPAAITPPASDSYEPSFGITYPSTVPTEKTIHLEATAPEAVTVSSKEIARPKESVISKEAAERVVESAMAASKEVGSSPEAENETAPSAANESATQTTTNRRQRQRRTTNEKQPSWWRTQGRALAVVFVVALGATIYLARAQRGDSSDTAREDESIPEVEISSAVSDDALDPVRPSHTPHIASKPKTSAPPLHSHDEDAVEDSDLGFDDTDLDEAEDAEASLVHAKDGDRNLDDEMTSNDVDDPPADDLPDHYEETDPRTHRPGGRVPHTAKSSNSSSTR